MAVLNPSYDYATALSYQDPTLGIDVEQQGTGVTTTYVGNGEASDKALFIIALSALGILWLLGAGVFKNVRL